MTKVGPERPSGPAQRGLYIGSAEPKLVGKTAIMFWCEGGWNIQTNDIATGFGFGWWRFSAEDWRVIPSAFKT